MALKVTIQTSKTVSKWREYTDTEGNVLAEFKIRGSGYKPYQVALERANNQINSKGFDVSKAGKDDKLYHELLLEAAACHLIEDWKGVVFEEKIDGGEVVETEPEYSPENAVKLLNMGDIGISIWLYVKQEAEDIQKKLIHIRMKSWESPPTLQLVQVQLRRRSERLQREADSDRKSLKSSKC